MARPEVGGQEKLDEQNLRKDVEMLAKVFPIKLKAGNQATAEAIVEIDHELLVSL